MRTKDTCATCTTIDKEKKQYTMIPDSTCEIRCSCPDDGSSTEKRRRICEAIPVINMEEEERDERKPEPPKVETPKRDISNKRKPKKKINKSKRSRKDSAKPKRSRRLGKLKHRPKEKMVKKK